MYFRIVEKLRGNCVRREVYHPGNSTLEFRFYTIDVFTQSVPPEKFNAGISNMKSCLVDKLTRLFEFRRRNATWEILWFFFWALFFVIFPTVTSPPALDILSKYNLLTCTVVHVCSSLSFLELSLSMSGRILRPFLTAHAKRKTELEFHLKRLPLMKSTEFLRENLKMQTPLGNSVNHFYGDWPRSP